MTKKSKSTPALMDDSPLQTLAQHCSNIMPHVGKRGEIIGSEDNIKVLLDILRIKIGYNVISKCTEIGIPDRAFSVDNNANASIAYIISKMKEIGMQTSHHKEILTLIADRNQVNPVEQWIKSKKWDGESRLKEFYDTITARDNEAKEAFIYRWMIGAVALACSPNGIDSSGILVLQGDQDLGKTWWFRKLVPADQLPNVARADASINPHDKDSVNQAISSWLVELGELDATFKRSEIAALKSFITRDYDMFRRPFMPADSRFPRRTAFMASVNPWYYLTDDTGNRRFWTIECLKVDSYHTINMQQVWAEIYTKWKEGDTWRLNAAEKKMLAEINEGHITNDPISEAILKKYDWESDNFYWRWLTATEILDELRVQRVTKAELRIAADTVRKCNGGLIEKKKNGRFLKVPNLKGAFHVRTSDE